MKVIVITVKIELFYDKGTFSNCWKLSRAMKAT